MLQPQEPANGLTKRQREVLDRLELGMGAKQIATDMGVSRNAVYQIIERLRRQGALAETYTPSGQPPRRASTVVGVATPAPGIALAPRESVLAELRSLARAGAGSAGPEYAKAIETAIASGDVAGLAYELGRLDTSGEDGLALELVESALRRLSVLPVLDNADE